MGSSTDWPGCTSPALYSNLTDASHVFAVTATDRVGNKAQPERVKFLVDTKPPSITDVRYPQGSQTGNFTLSFKADDGPLGSGIQSTECR